MVSQSFNFDGCVLTVAAVYCYHFPYMDHGKILSHKNKISAWDIANKYLLRLRVRIHKAALWFVELKKINECYRADRKKYQAVGGQPQGSSPSSTSSDRGGGLHVYTEVFEDFHKTLGGHNYPIRDWAPKSEEPHDFALPEQAEHEERRDVGTPIATPKIEPRETPETMSTRTTPPMSTSNFTAVNDPERVSTAPSDRRTASPVQRFTQVVPQPLSQVSQPSNGMIGPTYAYDMTQVPYQPYQPQPQYMAPATDPANTSTQIYNNNIPWPTQFAPTQVNESDMNAMGPAAPFSLQHTRAQMEARGIFPGDFSMFSNNPPDESMGYSQWPPEYYGSDAPWQNHQQ